MATRCVYTARPTKVVKMTRVGANHHHSLTMKKSNNAPTITGRFLMLAGDRLTMGCPDPLIAFRYRVLQEFSNKPAAVNAKYPRGIKTEKM